MYSNVIFKLCFITYILRVPFAIRDRNFWLLPELLRNEKNFYVDWIVLREMVDLVT